MNFLLSIAFGLIQKYLTSKIAYAPLREWVEKQVKRMEEVAGILTDSNRDNAAQLREFWEKERLALADDSIEAAIQIIEDRMKDGDAKELVLKVLRALDEQGQLPEAHN